MLKIYNINALNIVITYILTGIYNSDKNARAHQRQKNGK